jgi:RimJ/RimL family protein N-acetyltransferase
MSTHRLWGGTIRKLWPTEQDKFRDHLLRLDKPSRRMRFAHAVSDTFIDAYAAGMSRNGSIIYGYFDDHQLRATAELRKIGDMWGQRAEAAFTVESGYQDKGIATELLGRVIRSARNRGVHHLVMSCLAENRKMQSVARHHDAVLRFEEGEVVGEIVPETPSAASMFAEAMDDRMGDMLAVFDLQSRTRAARAA